MNTDNRNCNMPYPIYPPYQMSMPNMPINYQPYNNMLSNNTLEQQFNNLEQQINLLDKRVTALENSSINNNNYSSSNYQMM